MPLFQIHKLPVCLSDNQVDYTVNGNALLNSKFVYFFKYSWLGSKLIEQLKDIKGAMQAGTDLGQSGRLLFCTQPGRTNRKQRGALNINKTGYAFFLAVHAINCVGLRPWVYAFLRDDRMAFEAPRLSASLPPKRRAGNSRVISPLQWGVCSTVLKTCPGFRHGKGVNV